MSQPQPTIAFFGGTGGCAFAALVRALSAGVHVNALCRTPSKLEGKLKERGVDESTMKRHLNIISGNIKDSKGVRSTLLLPSTSGESPRLVDQIVSGIGTTEISFQWSLRQPIIMPDSRICANAIETVISTLQQIQQEQARATSAAAVQRPLLVSISTTGLSKRQRDVPILFVPLYHWLLSAPHEDKHLMEAFVDEAVTDARERGPVRGFVFVRPSLLMDGEASDKIRAGWEWSPKAHLERLGKAPGPAIGYTITRESVGNWMFEELITGQNAENWAGKMVTLTN